MTVERNIQQSAYGAKVQLFVVDASALGGEIVRLAPAPFNGAAVVFGGDVYTPMPIKISGLSWAVKGAVPRPVLEVSNLEAQFVTALLGLDDLVGASVTVMETFTDFLDDGATPDFEQRLPDEFFVIDQLQEWTSTSVRWQLSALLDQRGVKLPRRQILRDVCVARYRRHTGATFDYSKATCPYVGANYFDETNTACADTLDRCSKNLAACRLRFGENAELPFDGFPGAAKVRESV